jgi:hypothetical protein
MTKANTYIRPGGSRVECRECMADMRNSYRQRQKTQKAQTKQPARFSKVKEQEKTTRPLTGPDSPRGIVTQALKNLGGEVHDEQGRASGVLYKEAARLGYTGSPGGLNHLLLTMQNDGLIHRDKGGKQSRKCYLIQLLDYQPDVEPPEEKSVKLMKQTSVKAPRAEDLFGGRKAVNVPATTSVTEEEVVISPEERAKIDALLNDVDDDLTEAPQEPADLDDDDDEALALLLENLDPEAVVDALVERLRQPSASTAEITALQNKVFALEADLGMLTNDLRTARADYAKLQQDYDNVKTASDELLTEAARGQALVEAELAQLRTENAELRSRRPSASSMPTKDKAALKKALQKIQNR